MTTIFDTTDPIFLDDIQSIVESEIDRDDPDFNETLEDYRQNGIEEFLDDFCYLFSDKDLILAKPDGTVVCTFEHDDPDGLRYFLGISSEFTVMVDNNNDLVIFREFDSGNTHDRDHLIVRENTKCSLAAAGCFKNGTKLGQIALDY